MSMSPSNNDTSQDSVSAKAAASKARRTTSRATAPASKAADKAADKAGDAASAAAGAAERTAKATTSVAHTAAQRVEAGRMAVVSASGQAAAFAKSTWTLIANRKILAAGVGAGLTALSAMSYAAGRRSGRRTLGPITRMTGGRI
ncbi:hypothetical protein [Streptomyces chartreusis]|uniref:hypothetical protein n=1 Tax=Streptomyces chartreusis TaxID=1969 RepID=UPI0016748211|nr:hypothetical protein [Streptomyces chartreusis]